jgi:hypothetical protein
VIEMTMPFATKNANEVAWESKVFASPQVEAVVRGIQYILAADRRSEGRLAV